MEDEAPNGDVLKAAALISRPVAVRSRGRDRCRGETTHA